MKKIISFLLVAVMVIGFVPVFAGAESCDHKIDSANFLKDDDDNIICIEGVEGQNCHYSFCTKCDIWVRVQCVDSDPSGLACGDDAVCKVCGQSFVYHDPVSIKWRKQGTEVNCYWHCDACGADGTPNKHYYGEKKTYMIQGKNVDCGADCYSTCLNCGYVRSDATHIFKYHSDSTQHWQVCNECKEESEHENHTGGTATCTAKKVCTVCGGSYGEKADHVPDGGYHNDGALGKNHWLVCKNCNKVYQSNEHTFGPWYESTIGYQTRKCTVCGYTVPEKHLVKHLVTFECGYGSDVDDQTVIDGNCATNPGKLSSIGYDFVGWYKDEDCTVEFVFSDPITKDTTVYSKWQPSSYQITYLEKDGTAFKGSHEPGYKTKHTYGTETELLDASEDGYDFLGWYGTPSCSGYELLSLGAYDYTGEIFLYAKLSGHNYSVSYYPNNDESIETMDDSYHVFGTYSKLSKNLYTRTGYTFEKWTRNADGSGTSYVDQAKVNDLATGEGDNVKLFAKWKADEYAIKYFDQNGIAFSGDLSELPAKHVYGKDTKLPTAHKAGYKFDGWFTKKSCEEGSEITVIKADTTTSEVSVYAKWTAKQNYIAYNANGTGVTGTMDNQSIVSGVEVTLNENNFKRSGYTFLGWSDKSGEDNSVVYVDKQSGLTFSSDEPIELYAVWGKTYKVTLVTNGGTIAEGKNVVSYTNKVETVLPKSDDVIKNGYDFKGWYESQDLSGNPVTSIPATETGDKTYYAKWVDKTYTVTFNIVSTTSSSSTSTATGTATVVVDGGTATTVPASGLIWKDLTGSEVIKVTATPGTSYYAKIYTDKKTLATSSKGTAITYQLSTDDIKNNSIIKITFSVNPPTGDGFNPLLWVIAMASATAGAAITIAKKKAHK